MYREGIRLLGRVTSHLTIHSFTKEMPACFESLKTISFASFFFSFETGSFDIVQAVALPPLGYSRTLPCVALQMVCDTY